MMLNGTKPSRWFFDSNSIISVFELLRDKGPQDLGGADWPKCRVMLANSQIVTLEGESAEVVLAWGEEVVRVEQEQAELVEETTAAGG